MWCCFLFWYFNKAGVSNHLQSYMLCYVAMHSNNSCGRSHAERAHTGWFGTPLQVSHRIHQQLSASRSPTSDISYWQHLQHRLQLFVTTAKPSSGGWPHQYWPWAEETTQGSEIRQKSASSEVCRGLGSLSADTKWAEKSWNLILGHHFAFPLPWLKFKFCWEYYNVHFITAEIITVRHLLCDKTFKTATQDFWCLYLQYVAEKIMLTTVLQVLWAFSFHLTFNLYISFFTPPNRMVESTYVCMTMVHLWKDFRCELWRRRSMLL